MVLIQIELSEEENKIVNICKAYNSFITKEDTIKFLIRKYEKSLTEL